MGDTNVWEARARNNLKTLLLAQELHGEAEMERREKEEQGKNKNRNFESRRLRIRLFVPGQDLLDANEDLEVIGINKEAMTIYGQHIHSRRSHDTLISIMLGDIVFIGYCDQELQKKIIDKISG